MAERRISATEARVHFGELLDSVRQNMDVVFVERAGVPQVVVVSVDEWHRHTRNKDPWAKFAELIEEHDAYMAEALRTGEVKDFGDIDVGELIRAGREERDELLLVDLRGREPDHQEGAAESVR